MKFDSLVESILGEAQKPNRKPYHFEAEVHVIWSRKGGNLEGAPRVVQGTFQADDARLDSLQGGPRVVKGSFFCDGNKLTSLEGAPEIVGQSFFCYSNNLKTLEGAPDRVEEMFNCNNNPLESLKGISEAKHYHLPEGFTEEDARKEVAKRRFEQSLDKDTKDTFGDFIGEL